jgi:hypothetical protein
MMNAYCAVFYGMGVCFVHFKLLPVKVFGLPKIFSVPCVSAASFHICPIAGERFVCSGKGTPAVF